MSTQSENHHVISWQAICCSPSTSVSFPSSCKRRMVICLKFHLIYAAVEAEWTFNTIILFPFGPSLLLENTKLFLKVLMLFQLSSHNIRVNLWPGPPPWWINSEFFSSIELDMHKPSWGVVMEISDGVYSSLTVHEHPMSFVLITPISMTLN